MQLERLKRHKRTLPSITLWVMAIALGSTAIAQGEVFRDETGRIVNIPVEPSRVVSLAPSITECLFALGLDNEVVGVTQFSNYPGKATDLPKVGSYIHISMESVLALRPDLVIAIRDGNPLKTVERLDDLGLPVYVVDPRDLEGLFRTLEGLGRILNRTPKAEALVGQLRQRLKRIQQLLEGRPRPRVFLQIGMNPLVTVGNGTLQGQLVHLAGGENIAERAKIPYPAMSTEWVLEAQPDIILISTMTGLTHVAEQIRQWSRWKELPAVANGRLYGIDGDLINRPCPRILDGLEEMFSCIHPGIASGQKCRGE